jgi:hypothetical protein
VKKKVRCEACDRNVAPGKICYACGREGKKLRELTSREARLVVILDAYESAVREHQQETLSDYREAYRKDVVAARLKLLAEFGGDR